MKTRLEQCVLDLFDDAAFDTTLKKIACNLSDELKREQLPTIEDRNQLEDDQFALTFITKTASKLNKFPVNDKVNTSFSNEYFELNHHKLPIEAQKIAGALIEKACDRYDIEARNSVKVASMNYSPKTNIFVESVLNQQSVIQKTASPTVKFSENYFALGTKYAMPTEDLLRKAEQYFDKYAKKFSPEDRHEYANNVSKRSEELGIKIASVNIEKYAGSNYNPELEGHIKIRQKLLDDASPYIPALRKLASYQDSTEPITFAKVLHEIDKKAGLNKYYDTALSDPYASTFSSDLTKTAGYVYEKDDIYLTSDGIKKMANTKYDILKNYFGHTLADGLKKEGVAAFEALPDDAKDVIARISNGEIQ